MKPSSVRKKVRKPPNVTKELLYVILEPHNVRIEQSNLRKKKRKGTAKWEKKTITCDVGTAQCKDETVKCEKGVREPLNMKKNGYM